MEVLVQLAVGEWMCFYTEDLYSTRLENERVGTAGGHIMELYVQRMVR